MQSQMKFSCLVLSWLFLMACGDNSNIENDVAKPKPTPIENITRKTTIVRDINRLPLGNPQLLSANDNGLSMAIIANSEKIASLNNVTSARLPNPSSPLYLRRIQWVANASWFEAYGGGQLGYQKYQTIKRTDEQTLILGRLPTQQTGSGTSFARTDLLLINRAGDIGDGLTVFFKLARDSSSFVAQAFHIDDNQQIWLKGYAADENGVELQYSATYVILPSGKIRKIMSEW